MNVNATYAELALAVWEKFKSLHQLESYSGTLAMYAAERLAKIILQSNDDPRAHELDREISGLLEPFLHGEKNFSSGMFGKYIYSAGGLGAAWRLCRGLLPEALPALTASAEKLIELQPRNADRLFENPSHPGYITVDTIGAAVPFLLWIGRAAQRQDFIDEAAFQLAGHSDRLFDRDMKLFHQAFIPGSLDTARPGHNRQPPDRIESNLSANYHLAEIGLVPTPWSRGNGYAALALAETIYDLPKEHPLYEKLLGVWRELLTGFVEHQDGDGMWHQVLDDFGSYPESSGAALILYAMGRGIKNKSIDRDKFVKPLRRGLAAMMRFIAGDGSIFHCCSECFCPGARGTRVDYALWPWTKNDARAFAPVILMLEQAHQVEQRTGLIPTLREL